MPRSSEKDHQIDHEEQHDRIRATEQARQRFNGAALCGARKVGGFGLHSAVVRTSTGPRSVERGKPRSPWTRARSRRALQRGRALWSAERYAAVLSEKRNAPTSTGPRSVERGKRRCHRHLPRFRCRTSTGPRSVERGKNPPKTLPRRCLKTSTGPRSVERGKGSLMFAMGQAFILQRGRALWSAERPLSPMSSWPTCALQRGRALWSAERAWL